VDTNSRSIGKNSVVHESENSYDESPLEEAGSTVAIDEEAVEMPLADSMSESVEALPGNIIHTENELAAKKSAREFPETPKPQSRSTEAAQPLSAEPPLSIVPNLESAGEALAASRTTKTESKLSEVLLLHNSNCFD
jgi:hypothetical protein